VESISTIIDQVSGSYSPV